MKISANKEVRAEGRVLARLGFEFHGADSAGHLRFEHPGFGQTHLPATPKRSGAWRRHARIRVAKLMGLTLWQLERRIAGQPERRRTGKGRKLAKPRPPRASQARSRLAAAPAPSPERTAAAPVPNPDDPITPSRRALWRQNAEAEARRAAEGRDRYPWEKAA